MSEKKQPVDLGLLEEDDEFEEFPAEGRRLGLGLRAARTVTQASSGRRRGGQGRSQSAGGSFGPLGRLWRLYGCDPPCCRLRVRSVPAGLAGEAECLLLPPGEEPRPPGPDSLCPGARCFHSASRLPRS